jgi:hypothetical protein
MRRFVKIKIFFLLLLAAPTMAQTPRIVSLAAKPVDRNLTVAVQLAEVFSPKITGTIRSGMPAVIRFDFRLIEEPDREVQQAARSLHILYDLWNERYRLQFNGRERFVSGFAEMQKICENIADSSFLPLNRLSPQKSYRLRLQVAVIPISTRQSQQLQDWLEASDATEESAPGEERSTGFRFNISKFLSFFVGKKERPFGASEWVASPSFRLEQQ